MTATEETPLILADLPPQLGPREVTPLSVLQAARGDWQKRKKAWAAAGLTGDAGRDHISIWPTISKEAGIEWQRAVSVFDPHLTDLHYHWYAPPGGRILDPFAGGATRGLVAAVRGYHYTGVDLSPVQVEANREQYEAWKQRGLITGSAEWVVGAAQEVLPRYRSGWADYVFTCHPAGTRVSVVKRGLVPIEDVRPGDLVTTHTGAHNPVTETLKRTYSGSLFTFSRDYQARSLSATAEHPLLIDRNGSLEWRSAAEVRPGDCFVEPVPTTPEKEIDGQEVWHYDPTQRTTRRGATARGNHFVRATRETARLVGYYLAEGHPTRGGVWYAFNKNETEYHQDVRDLHAEVFSPALGSRVRPAHQVETDAVVVETNGVVASAFMSTAGRGAHRKRIPAWIWECSDELLIECLRGLWRGDGWVEKCGRLGFATVSERLCEDVRRGLLRLGVVASVRVRDRGETNFGQAQPQHCLVVRGVHADRLAELLGVSLDIPQHRRAGRSPWIGEDGWVRYRVRKVDTTQVRDLPVFNMEVENDHSYLAEGVASHNCPPYHQLEKYSDHPQDLSVMGWDEFVDAVNMVAGECARILRPDRFATWITGDIRDKAGHLRRLPSKVDDAHEAAGFRMVNDTVLAAPLGGKFGVIWRLWQPTRSATRIHQYAHTFVSGDRRAATAVCSS